MSAEHQAPPPATPANRHSGLSMLMGFAIGWAILIVAPVLAWIVMMLCAQWLGPSSQAFRVVAPLLTGSPLLLAGAVALYFVVKGHRRAAIGVAIALASATALALLLVAACFGIVALSGI